MKTAFRSSQFSRLSAGVVAVSALLTACANGVAFSSNDYSEDTPFGHLEYAVKSSTQNGQAGYEVTCKKTVTGQCLVVVASGKLSTSDIAATHKLHVGEHASVTADQAFCVQLDLSGQGLDVYCTPVAANMQGR